jgi:hypothetical protein
MIFIWRPKKKKRRPKRKILIFLKSIKEEFKKKYVLPPLVEYDQCVDSGCGNESIRA